MKKSKNKFKHSWIDDGKIEGIQLYTYHCKFCKNRKIKSSAFSASYYDEKGGVFSKAPDCVQRIKT